MDQPDHWRPGARHALYGTQATRLIEARALTSTPAHTLMQRAGASVFRCARALYPHARHVWVACGGGNNGGDGLVAALAWHRWFKNTGGKVTVGWLGQADRLPPDARQAWEAARDAGVAFSDGWPDRADLVIDALLGLGVDRPLAGPWAEWSTFLQTTELPVLCVDLPTGLDADTGRWWSPAPTLPHGPRHTLTFLTLKPGLFTGHGREVCGDLWWDDLGVTPDGAGTTPAPQAWLHAPQGPTRPAQGNHSAHKGSRGEVLVIGGQLPSLGQPGMVGAAFLAGRAALRTGAGRVYLGFTGADTATTAVPAVDPAQPELMLRHAADLMDMAGQSSAVTVVGCGGGPSVAAWLAPALRQASTLVLDADGLNAVAGAPDLLALLQQRRAQGKATVLTPHPLEAARLLETDTATVQGDRLAAARTLAARTGATVVLKGSGTVIASAGGFCRINPTGNGLLATAGTGDVLAGMVAAWLATGAQTDALHLPERVCDAVYQHGLLADLWSAPGGLTASDLCSR